MVLYFVNQTSIRDVFKNRKIRFDLEVQYIAITINPTIPGNRSGVPHSGIFYSRAPSIV